VYFSRASVLDGAFDDLTVGSPVAFVEEAGEKGPQASTVRVLGKHHDVAP
jgi:cold shock CspA family protein